MKAREVRFTCSCRQQWIMTYSHDTIGVISCTLVVTLPLEADLERPLREIIPGLFISPMHVRWILKDFFDAYVAWKLRLVNHYISAPSTWCRQPCRLRALSIISSATEISLYIWTTGTRVVISPKFRNSSCANPRIGPIKSLSQSQRMKRGAKKNTGLE